MHICMVISVPLPPREGIGYYVWNLTCFLMEQGHEVQIVTRGERGKPPYEVLEGIPIWRPSFYPTYPLHVHLHGRFVQRLAHRLEEEVDLFHLHSPLPPPVRTSKPQVVTAHTTLKAQAKVIPIDSIHSLLVRAQLPVSVLVEHRLFSSADKLIAYAQTVKEELGEYGVDPKHVEVLGNGVNTDMFCPAPVAVRALPAEPYIFAAARLAVRKGFEDLIDAMSHVSRQFPGVFLNIAGAGPLEGRLRARSERIGLGHTIRFLGHVERPQMVALYQGAMVFAHAAHYEGLPGVLLEAMACANPVVCTAVSGALDVVQDGVNGLFVPPHSPEALSRAICRLLGDAEFRARLGAAARCTVEERFSWKAVGSAYLRSYQSLLEGDRS
jgi:glycosyltransferase involved in cell wall biosynthesis